MDEQVKLVWLDKLIHSSENRQYQQYLRTVIKECIFLDNINLNNDDDMQLFKEQIPPIVLAGSSFAYNLVEKINEKIIVFCGNHLSHIELFRNNPHITTLISSGINEVKEHIMKNKDFIIASEQLDQQFNSKPLTISQYQHSNEALSLNFLFVNEQLKNKNQITEDNLNKELKALLDVQVYKDLEVQRRRLPLNLDLFKKLIYYYTVEYQIKEKSFYSILNQQLTKCQYHNISNIICLLFEGYSKLQLNQTNQVRKIFRGIPFNKENLEQFVKSFQTGRSYFWNHLISTSKNIKQAENFIKGSESETGILFEIELDSTAPHPHYEIQYSRYEEKEVLLFPQFQFIIKKKEEQKLGNKSIVKMIIQQKQNDFSMALDQTKREKFWIQRIDMQLRPQLQKIKNFYQSRIIYLLSLLKNNRSAFHNDIGQELKKEVDYYFKELIEFLSTLIEDKEQLQHYFEALQSAIQFDIIITQNFFSEFDFEKKLSSITDLLLEEFIKMVKKTCDIQVFYQKITQEWVKTINLNIGGLVLAVSQKVPVVGLVLAGGLFASQITTLCFDELLTKLETFEEIMRVGAKTATSFAGFWAGMEGGTACGALFGPCGMIAGGCIGGIIGGVGAGLVGREIIDQIGQFEMTVHFNNNNKGKIVNGYLVDPGVNPKIDIHYVRDKCGSLILLATTQKSFAWVLCNISVNTTQIQENCNLGRQILSYIGPTSKHGEITFHLIGITQRSVDEKTVIENLYEDKFKVVCYTKTVVIL